LLLTLLLTWALPDALVAASPNPAEPSNNAAAAIAETISFIFSSSGA
jgi:hypothetical protein